MFRTERSQPMARKKPQPEGKRPKGRSATRPDLPDPRMMEDTLRQLVAGLGGGADENTPLAKAQAVLQRAYQPESEKQRTKLAKQAVEICPDCADAYVLLA